MMLMAERRGLRERDVDLRGVGRTVNGIYDAPESKETDK